MEVDSYMMFLNQPSNTPCHLTPLMEPSTMAKNLRERLGPKIRELKGLNDQKSAKFRAAFFLLQFNIVELEFVLEQPLTDIKVPVLSWPLLDLPSTKVESKTLCFNITITFYFISIFST